jgi:hypothetical protein
MSLLNVRIANGPTEFCQNENGDNNNHFHHEVPYLSYFPRSRLHSAMIVTTDKDEGKLLRHCIAGDIYAKFCTSRQELCTIVTHFITKRNFKFDETMSSPVCLASDIDHLEAKELNSSGVKFCYAGLKCKCMNTQVRCSYGSLS